MTEEIAEQLAQARHDRGLSLQVVADRIGVTRTAVSQWENGVRTPSLGSLAAWAGVFGYRLTLTKPPRSNQ